MHRAMLYPMWSRAESVVCENPEIGNFYFDVRFWLSRDTAREIELFTGWRKKWVIVMVDWNGDALGILGEGAIDLQ